jgi:site-specific DNA-methyltransferase (adenine-specific)
MQGDSVQLMATFPDSSIDFILTDPPYLVGFRPVRALDRR